jgi:hypothetical protein
MRRRPVGATFLQARLSRKRKSAVAHDADITVGQAAQPQGSAPFGASIGSAVETNHGQDEQGFCRTNKTSKKPWTG